MEEKIMTLHPEGKQGVNISKNKYDEVKSLMLSAIKSKGEIYFRDLTKQMHRELKGKFSGSITWYTVTIKLDLEARGIIDRVKNVSPQQIRMAQKQEK